jgi:WD40 repeat protein
MQLDRAIKFINQLLLVSRQKELSELEILVFNSIWLDISYQESSHQANYGVATVKNTASKLLKDISHATGVTVSKKNCKTIISRLASIDRTHVDWGDAPIDLQPFCGRSDELDQLGKWLTIDRCKLVGILGIGGIGKTAVAAKLGDNIAADFDLTIWRSLREAPPLDRLMVELVQFLSEFTEIEVPNSSDRSIPRLLDYLSQKRCLIILDNLEAIMQSGVCTGKYRSQYADYDRLFQSIGTSRHQSCLLFTSREPPPALTELAGADLPVRSISLSGLGANAPILLSKVGLKGSEHQLLAIADRCQGNPLYLRIMANTIVNSFHGRIDIFLNANQFIYGKIADVLQSQLDRLSTLERVIIYQLAIYREPILLAKIEAHLQPLGHNFALIQTIDSLQQRSLLEVTQSQRYTLQNVVMEFMTAAMIQSLITEINNDCLSASLSPPQSLFLFHNLALYPASSPTYVREVQQRAILRPIVDRLNLENGRTRSIESCHRLLDCYRQHGLIPSYGVGNIINLLMALAVDFDGYDLSNLYIAEVDFQSAILPNVDFTGSTFDRCRFAQGIGTALKLTFSSNGKYLAVSDTMYQIKVWEVATNREIAMLIGHQNWVWDIQFSPDNKYIASGSSDETMRIWDLASGECLQVLHGHRDWVWKVNFVTSNLVISIGGDRIFKLWWWRTKINLLTFLVPGLQLRDGTFHHGRGLLASCGGEGINIWQVWKGKRYQKIDSAAALNLRRISFSPDGQTIIGTNFDCKIHLWDVNTGKHLFDLCGHPTQIIEVNYDEIGQMISTCGKQIRVWQIQTGACIQVINLGVDCGKAVAFRSPLIATGSDNGSIKVWNLETRQCITTLGGNIQRIMGLAANAHNQIVVTSRTDGKIQLWDFSQIGVDKSPEFACQSTDIQAHQGMAKAVAFSLDGKLIASTGSDLIIRIWDAITGKHFQSLTGHTDYILQVLFIDDRTILSQSYDKTIRQWDIITGEFKLLFSTEFEYLIVFARSPDCQLIAFGSDTPSLIILDRNTSRINTYPAIGNRLRHILFNPDSQFIIGITDDRMLNLWELNSNYYHSAWNIGDREVTSAILHPYRSHLLIVGSDDGIISIWNLQHQICLNRIVAHQHEIVSISIIYHPDRLVSCSVEGSIKLWGLDDWGLTAELYSIEFPMPYRNLQLSGVKGLNRSQLNTLVRLGATLS